MFGSQWILGGHQSLGNERLDRPANNYDIAGIPNQWNQGGLFECFNNIIPSCLLAFFCPCILFAQVAVRSQIPFLIALKNSIVLFRRFSGYNFFINLTIYLTIIPIICLLVLIEVNELSYRAKICLGIILAVTLSSLIYLLAHMRIAFKMKYSLPSVLPPGSAVFEALLDAMISICCLPCSLAQLARHVFQYDRWDPPIGFYLRDPSLLPPLLPAGSITRPEIADTAGLQWLDNRAIPGTRDNTGLAHRREIMNEQINIQIDRELDRGIDRHIDRNTNRQIDKELDRHITPAASAPASSIVYNADGSIAH